MFQIGEGETWSYKSKTTGNIVVVKIPPGEYKITSYGNGKPTIWPTNGEYRAYIYGATASNT